MSAADHKRPAAASGITIVLGGSLAPEVVAHEVVAREVVAREVVAREVVAREVVAREVVAEDTSHWLRSMGYKMLQKDFMYTPATYTLESRA